MSITVAELVALPHLGLEVVAGLAGLEREVGWAHVCELEDPRPWLEGGELVMTTGMAVPREPGRQAAYLERLAACGVAGLAISKDLCAPPLTPSFLRSAERLGFPVVAVSIEVPFVAIARIVVMANSDASSRQLVRQIAVFDALRDSTALSDLPALFRRLEHVSGFELYLCSPAGLPLLPGVPGIPDDRRDLLDRPGDAPAHVPGGYIVSVPVDGKNAGYLLGLRAPSPAASERCSTSPPSPPCSGRRWNGNGKSTAAKARNCWPSYWPGARPVSWPAGSMRCSARPLTSASP